MTFKRIYDYSGNDYKILIDRMWPRGIKKDKVDLWFKDIAPSRELVKEYHNDKDYDKFKDNYFNELDNNKEKVNELINLISSGDVVLLYSSKLKNNNATALEEYLKIAK